MEVEAIENKYPPTVEIVALVPGRCSNHNAPYYGCVHNGDHFLFCEEVLRPLSPTNRRRMN